MRLIAATGNPGKVKELQAILGESGFEVVTAREAGFEPPQDVEETADTFEGNALLKAMSWHHACSGAAVIADDSGLEVDALDGAPGVYSARYCDGGDREHRQKLLSELSGIPNEQRTARFVSVVCCVLDGGTVISAKGTCEGRILTEEHGDHGFGYDSIFLEKTTGRSFGELTDTEKDAVSHRGNALRKLAQKLERYQQTTEK